MLPTNAWPDAKNRFACRRPLFLPSVMNHPLALPPRVVLTFDATDPTGGSGVQADLMTIAAIGCHGLSVVTAVTVQDSAGVFGVMPVDGEWVEDQARAVLEDMPVDAFKIGLVGSVENIVTIANVLADYPDVPVVLDPVHTSGRGEALVDDEMLAAMRELLVPHTSVVAANSLELLRLAGCDASSTDPVACAAQLLESGCEHVLLTGVHANTVQVYNDLYNASGRIQRLAWTRLPGRFHGAGGTLAASVAACLAHGLALPDASREAQEYTWRALAAGFRAGMGRLIPDRFFWARQAGASNANDSKQEQDLSNDQ